ncbi:MAG: hypothetical protein ACRC1H_11245 [Caldilineaceae bacterium]
MHKELIDELLTEAGIQRSKFAPDCAGLLEAAAAALAQPAAPATPAWWQDGLSATLMREGVNKHRAREIAQGYWEAYCQVEEVEAQPAAPAVPAGWKLVPVEPTEKMLNAARDWSRNKYGSPVGNDGAQGCYAAMLAAAPQEAEAQPAQADYFCPDTGANGEPVYRPPTNPAAVQRDEAYEGLDHYLRNNLNDEDYAEAVGRLDALYVLAQPAAPAPLTIEQINALPEASVWWPCSIWDQVMRLIRAVERTHGIAAPEVKE